MVRDWSLAIGSITLGALAALLMASSVDAADVPGAKLSLPGVSQRRAYIVRNPIIYPAATVDRQLSDQPVHPYLVKVVVNHQTHYIDLDADYIRQGQFKIDENHWLPRAQRLARAMANPGPRIIVNKRARAQTPQQEVARPLFIIHRPKAPNEKRHPTPQNAPTVPGLLAQYD